jgi:type II secretory pathway pseudopilin PulG
MINNQRGFTLIELIVFIVGTSILVSTLLLSFQITLRGTPAVHHDLIANQLANQCMEGFIGERRLLGYTSALLNCSGAPTLPSVCTTITGFVVNADITCSPTLSGDSATSRTVTVNVTGLGNATLTSLIANY